jgi:hypothetical protein
VHVKNFEACTGSRKGLQFQNKQKNLASAAEPAQTEGEQSISSFNVYGDDVDFSQQVFFHVSNQSTD